MFRRICFASLYDSTDLKLVHKRFIMMKKMQAVGKQLDLLEDRIQSLHRFLFMFTQ